MNFPAAPVAAPDVVTRIAAGRAVRAVWLNELGGVTFSVDDGAEYVKVYPAVEAHQLVAEEPRLAWAAPFSTVPKVLSSGPGWLHTAGLPGRSAVDPYWAARPVTAAPCHWRGPATAPRRPSGGGLSVRRALVDP